MHWDSGLEDAITTQFSGAVEDFKLSQPDSPALEPKTWIDSNEVDRRPSLKVVMDDEAGKPLPV